MSAINKAPGRAAGDATAHDSAHAAIGTIGRLALLGRQCGRRLGRSLDG